LNIEEETVLEIIAEKLGGQIDQFLFDSLKGMLGFLKEKRKPLAVPLGERYG